MSFYGQTFYQQIDNFKYLVDNKNNHTQAKGREDELVLTGDAWIDLKVGSKEIIATHKGSSKSNSTKDAVEFSEAISSNATKIEKDYYFTISNLDIDNTGHVRSFNGSKAFYIPAGEWLNRFNVVDAEIDNIKEVNANQANSINAISTKIGSETMTIEGSLINAINNLKSINDNQNNIIVTLQNKNISQDANIATKLNATNGTASGLKLNNVGELSATANKILVLDGNDIKYRSGTNLFTDLGGITWNDLNSAVGDLKLIEDNEYPGCYYQESVTGEKLWLNPPAIPNKNYRTLKHCNGQCVSQAYTIRTINAGSTETNWTQAYEIFPKSVVDCSVSIVSNTGRLNKSYFSYSTRPNVPNFLEQTVVHIALNPDWDSDDLLTNGGKIYIMLEYLE